VSAEHWAHAAARGVAWGMAATFAARFLWLGAMAVLARLLAPAEFGLYALGLLFVLYVETVGDFGFSAALIQSPRDERRAAQAAFLVNVALGLLWGGATWLLAEPVAELLRTPEGAPVLRALAPAFLLKALGNTHDALCQKRLRFRERFLPEAAMAAVKSALAVALALAGFGIWSLVVAQLAGLAVWTLVLWRVIDWRPRAAWPERALVAELFRFGRWIVVVHLLAAIVHHADKLVVGRELGAAALGLYQMAAKVVEVSIVVWIWVVGRVLFPSFARLHAAGEPIAPAYLRALRAMSVVTLPGAALLALCAGPLLRTLFGDDWGAAAPVLRMLALAGALRALGSSAGDLLKSTGASGTLAVLAAIKAVLLLPAIALAAARGALAVAAAFAAVTGAGLLLDVSVAARRQSLPAGAWLRSVAPGIGVAAAIAAAAWALLEATAGWPDPARLAAVAGAGGVLFLLALSHLEPALWLGLRSRGGAAAVASREAEAG
jgi:lipopolysaccharide exporter